MQLKHKITRGGGDPGSAGGRDWYQVAIKVSLTPDELDLVRRYAVPEPDIRSFCDVDEMTQQKLTFPAFRDFGQGASPVFDTLALAVRFRDAAVAAAREFKRRIEAFRREDANMGEFVEMEIEPGPAPT